MKKISLLSFQLQYRHDKISNFIKKRGGDCDFALNNQVGGEILFQNASCRVIDICSAINKKRKIKYVGIRPGEKL